jgi:hypothetical protein
MIAAANTGCFPFKSPALSRFLDIGFHRVELIVERFDADAELFGCRRFVPMMPLDSFLDGNDFEFLEAFWRFSNRDDYRLASRRFDIPTQSALNQMLRQMLWHDWRILAQDRCVFDDISQLTYIPRPRMLQKQLDRLLRKNRLDRSMLGVVPKV